MSEGVFKRHARTASKKGDMQGEHIHYWVDDP